eukprot:Amastigsp_a3757_4.p2 type:complete len:155 gc:universal Amastigsp_a3757_4:514-50(-)
MDKLRVEMRSAACCAHNVDVRRKGPLVYGLQRICHVARLEMDEMQGAADRWRGERQIPVVAPGLAVPVLGLDVREHFAHALSKRLTYAFLATEECDFGERAADVKPEKCMSPREPPHRARVRSVASAPQRSPDHGREQRRRSTHDSGYRRERHA